MERFSDSDLALLREFLKRAAVPGDLSMFAATVMPAIHGLVPGELVCHAQVDPVAGRLVTQLVYPQEASESMDRDAFERYMMEHPIFVSWAMNGTGSAARTSDFVSRRQWHQSSLYNQVYRVAGCNDSLAVSLPAPPGLVACFCIERGREFSDREKALMDFVRPHLENSYRTAELFTLLGGATTTSGPFSIVLDGAAKPRFIPGAAERLLTRYFPEERLDGGLPASLSIWARRCLGAAPSWDCPPIPSSQMVDNSVGGRLSIRFLAGHLTGQQALLLLHETRPLGVSAAFAEEYRLTPREVEVLTAATRGLEPASIADEFFLSRRTVEKHLENIYSKLGVESRSAAVAKALEV